MRQRGKSSLGILIALIVGVAACFFGYSAFRLDSGTKGIQESVQAALRSHSRKLELFDLRLKLARMYATALGGGVGATEGIVPALRESSIDIQRSYRELSVQAQGDPVALQTLSELEPHLQALISALNQTPTGENVSRWRGSFAEFDRKLSAFGAEDDTRFEARVSALESAFSSENAAVHAMQTLAIGLAVCVVISLLLYLGALFQRSGTPVVVQSQAAENELRFASFNKGSRAVAKSDPDLRRYRDDFISSFPSRLQELDAAIKKNPVDGVEPAQLLADAAATHQFEALSSAAGALHVALRGKKPKADLLNLLAGVRKCCDDISKSIL